MACFICDEINLSLTMSYFCLSDSVLTDNQRSKFYFEQVFLTQSVRQNCVESVQIGKNTSYLSVFSINAAKVDQKNSEYGQFSCRVCCWLSMCSWSLFLYKSNEILSCRGHTGKWMLTLSWCLIKGDTYLNKPAAFSCRFV